jgi:hypothetical protein
MSSPPKKREKEITSNNEGRGPTYLDKIEQASKILATALIPVIIAIGGWIIQTTIEKDKERAAQISSNQQSAADKEKVSLEYVKLAKEILTSEKQPPKELTKWSWRLIDQVSPRHFDPEDLDHVIEGNVKIPSPPANSERLRQRSWATPSNLDGFVISVLRARTERRSGSAFSRTIGYYHVFFDGQQLAGLDGMTVERQGPGDNSPAGAANHRRLEAGVYPLYTSGGDRYRTYGYADPGGLSVRPWPAIRIEDTGDRAGIIIHPAAGYLMSIGTINLSKPLAGPAADIDYADSRQRTIALIDAMKEKLGNNFPGTNNMLIQNAWIVIAGEPSETSTGEPDAELAETPN